MPKREKRHIPDLPQSDLDKLSSIQDSLTEWFETHGRPFPWRSPESSVFEKVLTEILLQRTKAETVARNYKYFFSKYVDWTSIDAVALEELQGDLKPLGIWKRRSEVLKKLSAEMMLRHGVFPSDREQINRLTGVGQYVGNAIELFAFSRPRPLLDANMARVIERVFRPRKLADIRYDPWLQKICQDIVSCDNPSKINWAFLDLGASTCRHNNPECNTCPLRCVCSYSNRNRLP